MPLLDIDVQGAIKFEQTFPQSNFVAVCPLEFADLEGRLRQRGTETEQQLQTRFRNAQSELDTIFKLKNTFQYRIYNDVLAEA